MNRREFLSTGARGAALLTIGGAAGALLQRAQAQDTVWQVRATAGEPATALGDSATLAALARDPTAAGVARARDADAVSRPVVTWRVP